MTHHPETSSLYNHVDVTQAASISEETGDRQSDEMTAILREILAGQDRQNHLLEELVQQMSAAQKQRATELGQWKQANPRLARGCRRAAEALSQVQTRFLENLTDDVNENIESMIDGDFVLNEFVDRYGPRLAHLNGVLQILTQLSSVPNVSNSP